MFDVDGSMLDELGLGSLPEKDRELLLEQIYETLEMRVGMVLAGDMTDAQLDEFEAFIDDEDEDGALAWLKREFPDYKQCVSTELYQLKAEVRRVASQILLIAGKYPPEATSEP